jgi:putative membrane protein
VTPVLHVPTIAGSDALTDALLVAAATLCYAGYHLGAATLRSRDAGRRLLPGWRVVGFGAALYVGAAAVSSPAEHLAEELFSAHMVQHLVLAFVVAPLLVLGRPVQVLSVLAGGSDTLRAPLRHARRLGVRLRDAPVALAALGLLHVAPWVAWHVPTLYERATRSPLLHLVEHVTLVASGMVLTWFAVGRRDPLPTVATVVAGMVTMSAVAAALTFGRTTLYDVHDPGSVGLDRLTDQQIGGALMWFPGALPYLAAVAALVLTRLVADRKPDPQWSYK